MGGAVSFVAAAGQRGGGTRGFVSLALGGFLLPVNSSGNPTMEQLTAPYSK